MTDPPVAVKNVHPRGRLILPAGLLVLAGALMFHDLTHSNRVHELDSPPYAAAALGALMLLFDWIAAQ